MAMTTHKFIVSIGIVCIFGVTSTWLSSCSDTVAADTDLHVVLNQSVQDIRTQVTDGNADGTVANKLNKIQATLNGTSGTGTSGDSVLTTISKLSDDIGLMSDRIGDMADRIVETEKMIVAVISMQTGAATGLLEGVKDPNGGSLLTNLDPVNPNASVDDPVALLNLLSSMGSTSSGVDVVLSVSNVPTATMPPAISYTAPNSTARYELLVSENPRFPPGTVIQLVNSGTAPGGSDALDTVWVNAMNALSVNGVPPVEVYIAVKSISSTNQVSAISNSLKLVL